MCSPLLSSTGDFPQKSKGCPVWHWWGAWPWNPPCSHTYLMGLHHSAFACDRNKKISGTHSSMAGSPSAFLMISPPHLTVAGALITTGVSVCHSVAQLSPLLPPCSWFSICPCAIGLPPAISQDCTLSTSLLSILMFFTLFCHVALLYVQVLIYGMHKEWDLTCEILEVDSL